MFFFFFSSGCGLWVGWGYGGDMGCGLWVRWGYGGDISYGFLVVISNAMVVAWVVGQMGL